MNFIMAGYEPVYLKIDITKDCILNCRYCPQVHKREHFEKDLVGPLVDFLAGCRRDFVIDFFGGEPLLNFGVIISIVEECKRRKVIVRNYNLTTNGVLLADTKKIDYLAINRFIINFSVDGPARVHLKNRRSDSSIINSHKIIVRAIQYMKSRGYPFGISAVFHKNTISSLDRSMDFLLGLAGDPGRIMLHPAIGFLWRNKDFQVLREALARLVSRRPAYLESYRKVLCKKEHDYICRDIYIDHRGYVYPTNLFCYKQLRCRKIHLCAISDHREVFDYLRKKQLELRCLKYDDEMTEQFKIINFVNEFFAAGNGYGA